MNDPFEEVFNKHYQIGDNTFKVVFSIKRGSKLDDGMAPYHFIQIQKLPDTTKYNFRVERQGMSDERGLTFTNEPIIKLTWSDAVHRELYNKIKNEIIPSRYFNRPDLQCNFF